VVVVARSRRTAKRSTPTKGSTKEPTRAQRRRSRDTRRARFLLIGAVGLSAAILAAWFPASALYHQRSDLASATSQLNQLHQQDVALTQERKNLSSTAEIARIAREQYQLVSPGQQAYEVLPPSGKGSASAPYAGDPGTQAPVAPSANSELPPGSVTPTTVPAPSGHSTSSPSSAAKTASGSPGTLERMWQALEFWR
jgi:cell division protein FtsB